MSDPKRLIHELVEEVLDEMTSTGAVAGYSTPNAFRGHKSKKAAAARSMPGGKVVGNEDTDDTTVGEDRLPTTKRGLEEGRYQNFKSSEEMKNHAKISYGIREAKKILREVDFLVGLCERLQTEDKVGAAQLWKRTRPDIISINKQLKEISKRVYRIGKK